MIALGLIGLMGGCSSSEPATEGDGGVETRGGLPRQVFEPGPPRFVALKPAPVPNGAIACSRDQGNPQSTTGRDLDGYMWSDPVMTNAKCRDSCARRGFVFAGTQYGSYCFCGERHGQIGPATNCDTGCSGNAGEICGGAWANSVSLSGSEPTLPSPPSNGGYCLIRVKGDYQDAARKIVHTYRHTEVQRWVVTGPPIAKGTGYVLPVLWTTTGSGSLHEDDGRGGVTDSQWGISGHHRGQFQQRLSGGSWNINQAQPPFSIADGIVEMRQQTINSAAQPVAIARARAVEFTFGDILTFGRVSVISHGSQFSVDSTAKYGYRQPAYSRGLVQCESRINLGHP